MKCGKLMKKCADTLHNYESKKFLRNIVLCHLGLMRHISNKIVCTILFTFLISDIS